MNWPVILMTYLNLFAYGLLDNSRSTLLPELMAYFNLSHSQVGLFFTLGSGLGLLVNLLSFWWLRRFTTIIPMRISILLSAIGAFCISLSGSLTSVNIFFLSFLMIGFSAPLSSICMNIIVKAHTPENKRAKTYSGLHSLYGLASFLAPVFIGFYGEWKQIYLFIAIMFTGVFIYSFKLKHHNFTKAKVSHLVGFSAKYQWAIVIGLYIPMELLMSSRLTVILQEHYHFSQMSSARYLSFFFLLLFLGRFTFSQIKHHANLQRQLFISIFVAFFFFLGAIFIHPLFFCLVGGALSIFYPMLMSHMSFKVGEHFEALSNFCIMSTTLSMTVFHFTFGKSFEVIGIGNSLYLFPILCVLILISLGRLFKQK
jgi:fucose permease